MIHYTLLAGLLMSCYLSAAENLLVNPGFENGDNHPTGWTFNHRGTEGQIVWDKTRASAGEHSIRLTNVAEQTGNVFQSVQIDPPLPPGSLVSFGAMSATEDAGAPPSIIVYLQPPSGSRETVVAKGSAGTHDFQEVVKTVTTDRPVGSIVIYLCHYGTGSAWWDDAFITVGRGEQTKIIDRPPSGEKLPALQTADGLSLTLTDAGAIASVRVDDIEVAASAMRSGIWVRPWRGDMVPVTGTVTAGDNAIHQRWRSEEVGLQVIATWSAQKEAIVCQGEVSDLTGEERGVDVIATLPVGAAGEGWLWADSIMQARPLWQGTEEDEQRTAVFAGLNDLTFATVVRPGEAGLSLAVPADHPCICDFEWTPEFGLAIRFKFGLSPAASGELQGKAPFAFTIYRVDPAWGMRDAVRRYQQLNGWAFEKRVDREGLWMFGQPRIDLPDPENYAFHEGGPTGWQYDENHGIYTCPYVIPGQREIKGLEHLPTSAAEALEIFRTWEPTQGDRPRGWGGEMLKAIIENCMLHDVDGQPVVEIRNTPWGGNSITFPLNANPWLFADTLETPTVARTVLDGVRSMHDAIPQLDGIYVDSLGHWGNFVNFRREHFAAEHIPLTYEATTGRPVIDNRFTLLEFLWELGDYLHERGKLLFANGLHPNRCFHFFALDVMGVEGRSRLEHKRTMAGPKPFLLLIYNIEDDPAQMEYWFNLCTHWGIYPSFGNMSVFDTPEKYAPVAELNRRYVPVLQTITRAGWRPVTHAVSDELMVERWGPGADGALFLTVYNPAEEAVTGTVTIEANALGLTGGTLHAEGLFSGESFQAPVVAGRAALDLPVEAQQVQVLRLAGR